MLTIHAGAPTAGGAGGGLGAEAVVVRGERIAEIGPRDELVARYPDARVRDWPGRLAPALVHDAPVPDAPSPRERVHALLRIGATAVTEEHLADPGLLAAAVRGGVRVVHDGAPGSLAPGVRADLAVFDARDECLATVLAGRLVHRRA